jgi:hypothetical protein
MTFSEVPHGQHCGIASNFPKSSSSCPAESADSPAASQTRPSPGCSRSRSDFVRGSLSRLPNRPLWLVLTSMLFIAIVNIAIMNTVPVGAEDRPLHGLIGPLTDDERNVMASIREASTRSTVTFLASDEFAGRDTPSPELNIAAAYIVSRFQSAGLDGLGPDGSFLQTTTISVSSLPAAPAELFIDDRLQKSPAILFAADTQELITGVIEDGNQPGQAEFSGAVWLNESPLPPESLRSPARELAGWKRRVQQLASRGARAVLIRPASESRLPELIDYVQNMTPEILTGDQKPLCPTLVLMEPVPPQSTCRLTVSASQRTEETVSNVIGVLRGSDRDQAAEAILITAHLDHIGHTAMRRSVMVQPDAGGISSNTTQQPAISENITNATQAAVQQEDTVYNGADDNASGVTTVLELADAYSALQQRPQRSVVFITFWGEEKGLLGSRYFVQHPLWPLDRIIAHINIEMVGRPERGAENQAWGTGWGHSNLGPIMAEGAARADVRIFQHPQLSELLYTRSDNDPFAKAGVVAHSFSGGSLHDDYHQLTDEVDKLNIPHMTHVIRGLFAGSLPIARAVVSPSATRSP